MNNQEALDLLSDFVSTASAAVQSGVWAQAYLTEGGEPTWDAVKSVSRGAALLGSLASRVADLEDAYEDITPF